MLTCSDFITGTDMFQLRHIIFLIFSLAIVVALPILAVKYKVKKATIHKVLLIEGIVSESIKVITYIILNESALGGYLPKGDLPFHLCSIQLIFIAILNLSKNEKVHHFLYSFMLPTCLVGGIAALFIATASSRNNFLIGIQYFSYHSMISAFAIYLLINKEIVFTVKDYWKTLAMLCVVFFIAIYLNSILYTPNFVFDEASGTFVATEYMPINFMYVYAPPQSGLPFLNKNHGWGVYIVHYAFTAFVAVTACYIKPIIDWFNNKTNNQEKNCSCE